MEDSIKRFCLYCNADITDTKFDRITCNSVECSRRHDLYIRKNKKVNNYCVICGKDISHKLAKAKLCGELSCKKEYNRLFYKNRKKNKKCIRCGVQFLGTGKRTHCDTCSMEYKYVNNGKISTFISRCKTCNKELEKVLKHKHINNTDDFIYTCEDCKKLNWERSSDRMKVKNPMFVEGQTEKKEIIIMSKEEFSLQASQRMTNKNPMFDPAIRKKASETFKERIRNKTIVYKKGPDHHRWKGNRLFNRHCRISLRAWSRKNIEDSNYTCNKCGEIGGELHTHHKVPLRNIIKISLDKFNTNSIDVMKDEELLKIVTDYVVNYHSENKVGEVLCKVCHGQEDPLYKRIN